MSAAPQSVFAVLTPPGRGGIAVIRCAGHGIEPALAACFRRKTARRGSPDEPTAGPRADLPAVGSLAYGHIVDADGLAIDEVILFHAPPASSPRRDRAELAPGEYTGGSIPGASPRATPASSGPPCIHGGLSEVMRDPAPRIMWPRRPDGEKAAAGAAAPHAFEINCHGGPAAVAAIGLRLASLGLRAVDPDALLALEGAGPIELAARRRLRGASSPLAARILLDQLSGALTREVVEIVAALAGKPPAVRPRHACRARVAPADGNLSGASCDALARLDALLARWQTCGRFLADPPRIVIAGRPNAGKSTLLNRLAGADRAITSPVPGTTRDYVEAAAAIEGLPVVLVDTAGLRPEQGCGPQAGPRDVDSAIEQAGVERARAEAARADVVVYLVDAREGFHPEDAAAIAGLGRRAIVAWNKVDLTPSAAASSAGATLARQACRGLTAGGLSASVHPTASSSTGSTAGLSASVHPMPISALTGAGIPALVASVLARLGWQAPAPGEAVPFTPDQAAALRQARDLVAAARPADARVLLAALTTDASANS